MTTANNEASKNNSSGLLLTLYDRNLDRIPKFPVSRIGIRKIDGSQSKTMKNDVKKCWRWFLRRKFLDFIVFFNFRRNLSRNTGDCLLANENPRKSLKNGDEKSTGYKSEGFGKHVKVRLIFLTTNPPHLVFPMVAPLPKVPPSHVLCIKSRNIISSPLKCFLALEQFVFIFHDVHDPSIKPRVTRTKTQTE